MAWEVRNQSKRKFYYRSVRSGRRVTKQYLGPTTNPVAQFVAMHDKIARAEKAARVAEVRAEQAAFKELQPLLSTHSKQVREELSIRLLARGYRKQKEEWKPMTENRTNSKPDTNTSANEKPTREEFQFLMGRAKRGDRDAAARLCRIIENDRDIWEPIGDLTKQTETSLIEMISRGNLVLEKSLRMAVKDLRNRLLGETTDDPVIDLLVDEIVVVRLELQFTRMAANQHQQHKRDAEFWDKRYDRANARFAAAIRELVAVRQLLGDSEGAAGLAEAAGC